MTDPSIGILSSVQTLAQMLISLPHFPNSALKPKLFCPTCSVHLLQINSPSSFSFTHPSQVHEHALCNPLLLFHCLHNLARVEMGHFEGLVGQQG